MLRPMTIDQIGSGIVERAIVIGNEKKLRGYELTHEVLAQMPAANRNALIENHFISVFPKSVTVLHRETAREPIPVPIKEGDGEMHVVAKGFGKWDVIQGTLLGSGLTRDEANALAGKSASVNETVPVATAPKGKKKKRRASPGKRLPAKPPGEPQENGPIGPDGEKES